MNWRKRDEPRVERGELGRREIAEELWRRERRRTEQSELTGLGSDGWELRVVCEQQRERELGGAKWRCSGGGLGAQSSGVTRRLSEAMVTNDNRVLLS
ncbi:hypothetical protein M0R45_015247 [Rubus argutus]|uniref:Uncharacterized protein n=1 Tax=Rubus argutus TaxID=59490 RepID=A0AAW1XQ91_RUBAR